MSDGLSFISFAEKIESIYGQKNSGKKFEYAYGYLCRNTSYLSRSILRGGDSKIFFIKSFSWLFAVAQKLEIDIGLAFRKKFPGVCPYCISSVCQCAETHKAPINNLPIHEARKELNEKYQVDFNHNKELLLDKAIIRISTIYPSNKSIWKAFGSFYHFSRLFEELGEVHEAFTAYNKTQIKTNLEEELADVTAWLLSAWGIEHNGLSLSDCIIDYYIDNCPVCKAIPCRCEDYSDRTQMLSDETSLKVVKLKLSSLLELNPSYKTQIIDLITAIDSAITTTSTLEAQQIIATTKILLNQMETTLGQGVPVEPNSEEIINTIRETETEIDSMKFYS